MKIKSFRAEKINGYLDISIISFNMLSFVTGINGSGKTSALNSIIALLLPRIDFLAIQEFLTLEVVVNDGSHDITISAIKDGQDTLLSCNAVIGSFKISPFLADPEIPPYRLEEYEVDYYRDLLSSHAENPLLSYLLSLPTPMYLGLDRRMILNNDSSRFRRRPSGGVNRRSVKRNIFSASLRESLEEALYFSERRYRDANISKSRLDERFRRDIILDLIDLPPISYSSSLHPPSQGDLRRLEAAKNNLRRLPALIGIPEKEIMSKLSPLFDFLDEAASRLSNNKLRTRRNDIRSVEDPDFSALIDWSFNKVHIDKINKLSMKISDYNNKVNEEFADIQAFLDSINSFVADSGKEIMFDESGSLCFSIWKGDERRSLPTMSSGEIQLFVILAHLHFNPDAKNTGVFIIDEPELSLHVQWQEKFVDEIMRAAPSLQYILATHSPSIILDKTMHCIDISHA